MTKIEAIPGIAELWQHTTGDPSVVIGVVEGPPDLAHPCFDGADLTVIRPSWLPAGPVHPLAREHGTFTASILFGRHGTSAAGLTPRCRGVLVPALRDQHTVLDPLNAARAIDTLVQAGAHIIHFTAAQPTRSQGVDPLLAQAIDAATRGGVLVIAPTGNDYGRNYVVPGILPQVLAVGAHRDNGHVFQYSNWGPPFRHHGIVAPGAALRAAVPGGGTTTHQGTSIATPIVSGVAALLASLQQQHGVHVDTQVIRNALLGTAQSTASEQAQGDAARCLAGRLDVPAATRSVLRSVRRSTSTSPHSPASRPVTPALRPLVYATGTLAPAARLPDEPLAPRMRMPHDRHGTDASLHGGTRAPSLTLDRDGVPLYALRTVGPFAPRGMHLLRRLLAEQSGTYGGWVCVPGRLSGQSVTVASGRSVPVVDIELPRGVHHCDPERAFPSCGDSHRSSRALHDLFAWLSRKLRNPGLSARHRALNFAVSAALQPHSALTYATAHGHVLQHIDVDKSRLHRTGGDCWDVAFRLVNHESGPDAPALCRLTVDVGSPLPSAVRQAIAWHCHHHNRSTP
ncbi:S8 family serine peptidase [Streptomyces sp. NPDC003006]